MRSLEALINRQINRWNSIQDTLAYPAGISAEKGSHLVEPARRHPAICFSRDLGAGAREIAQIICDRTGYELLGKNIINELARDLNVQRRLVDSLDETARGRLELMIDSLLTGREIDNEDYFKSLMRVIETFGIQGGVLLLGRGTPFVLKKKAGLCVLITGSEDIRVQRVMHYSGVGEEEARHNVKHSDHDRHRFIKVHFNAELYDPSHYDLCINTDRIEAPDAADLILLALERRGYPLETLRIPEIKEAPAS